MLEWLDESTKLLVLRVGETMPTDVDLLENELSLQREADDVENDLGLLGLLNSLGRPVRVGSAALGVMVHRDLDVTVVCPELNAAAVGEIGAQLAAHPGVRSVSFRNDTGEWNVDPTYPDGLYLGIHYRCAGGDWNVDIWFVDEPQRQPDLNHLDSLLPRIDQAARAAILRIKSRWAANPEYGKTVSGLDIYTAVLDAGVTDPEGFEMWLRQK
jgi:hypothetical protein